MTKKPDAAERKPMEIIYRKLEELKPDPNNAREHPPEQIAVLRASIKQYGPTTPIFLKSDGLTIGAGNGRWGAAILEGYKEWPTVTLELSEAEWTAYAIMDNKSAMGARWNEDRLRSQLVELSSTMGQNVAVMTGFKAAELGKLKVPGFNQRQQSIGDAPQGFGVIVTVESEAEQTKLLERLLADGLKVKALL